MKNFTANEMVPDCPVASQVRVRVHGSSVPQVASSSTVAPRSSCSFTGVSDELPSVVPVAVTEIMPIWPEPSSGAEMCTEGPGLWVVSVSAELSTLAPPVVVKRTLTA